MIHKIKGDFASRQVWIDGKPLSPEDSLAIHQHSPDGFMWGYGGSGPAQLALAILIATAGNDLAERYYQEFKWEFVCQWKDNFETEVDVLAWLAGKEQAEEELYKGLSQDAYADQLLSDVDKKNDDKNK